MHTKLSIALGGVYLKVYTCVWRESSGKNGNPFSQYARSKRPADSVHWHAPSVPANLGRRISERMGRLTLGPYWPASRSKCVGPSVTFQVHWPMGFHISTWVGVHIYIWMFAGCSPQIDQNSSADYTL